MSFADRLIGWYRANRRELPWRQTADPYAIWVSEIMLQQTLVATVVPYWTRWMERWPSVAALALAREDEVLAAWSGLGYYRRARNLHQGAKWVVEHGMPQSYKAWLDVPGVGEYTAGAISSISFGRPVPAVDANVARVYARLNADESRGSALTRRAANWARQELPSVNPGDFNQALMELGALICTARRPKCGKCVFRKGCAALQQDSVDRLPSREVDRKRIELVQTAWIHLHEKCVGLRRSGSEDWWQGMYVLPRTDGPPPVAARSLGALTHSVTHHRIRLHVAKGEQGDVEMFPLDEVERLPIPSPDRRALRMLDQYALEFPDR